LIEKIKNRFFNFLYFSVIYRVFRQYFCVCKIKNVPQPLASYFNKSQLLPVLVVSDYVNFSPAKTIILGDDLVIFSFQESNGNLFGNVAKMFGVCGKQFLKVKKKLKSLGNLPKENEPKQKGTA